MKIFEIGTGYTSIPPRMGAATELVVQELTTSFLKLKQDVTIVDIKDKNRLQTDLPIEEVYMPQFFSSTDTSLGIVHKLKRVLYSISLTYKLHRLIKKEKGKKIVLHFHNQYNLFFFYKLTPKRLLKNVTIAYTVHSYIWFGKWEDIKDTASKRYFQEIYCCQHADKVCVLNEIVSKMLVDHYDVNPNNIVKVINGVNTDVYNSDNTAVEIGDVRRKYNLDGKKVMFQVGSVCDRKNQLGSIQLLLPLLKEDNSFVYMFAGGIIDQAYLDNIYSFAKENNIDGQVIYAGEVTPGKELNFLYSTADCTIMNSKSEAFALVIAESLSAKRPIFINPTIMSSLAFLGKKEGHGIIRIKDSFIADLKRLLTDKEYYKDMQEKGRQFIVDEFSWDVAARQYLKTFE